LDLLRSLDQIRHLALETADEVFGALIATVDVAKAINLGAKVFDVIQTEKISTVDAVLNNLSQKERKAFRCLRQDPS